MAGENLRRGDWGAFCGESECNMNIRDRVIRLERVPASQLQPNPKNWRTHPEGQQNALRGILAEVGIAGAVLARETPEGGLMLIDGHLRAETLGNADVPVLVLDVNEAEADKLLATIDPLGAMAEADADKLRELLEEVETASEALADMFTDLAEEAGILDGLNDAEITEDEVPEPPADPITKPGDLWLLGDHRLLCGDSTKADDVERLMTGATADLCFTSPPYNLGKSVGLRNGARKNATSAYNDMEDCGEGWADMMRKFMQCALRAASECAVNVQLLSGNKTDLLQLIGEYSNQTIDVAVWVKSNPQPAMADGVMTSAFEFVWLLRGEDRPNRKINGASFHRGTFSNVFQHATASGHDASIHGAVFPLAVAGHFIGNLSSTGSSVYEPFCGSGTTLIASEQLGRKCYGMEISPAYCDVIVKRWETLTGRQATREGAK